MSRRYVPAGVAGARPRSRAAHRRRGGLALLRPRVLAFADGETSDDRDRRHRGVPPAACRHDGSPSRSTATRSDSTDVRACSHASPTSSTPAATPSSRSRATTGGEIAVPSAKCDTPPARPLRRRRRRGDRDPWRRPGHAPGHELRQPRGVGRRRPADVRGIADPRRQLVELPAPQARRLARVPGQQRGDLLLPDRRRRLDRLRARTVSACIARTRATAGSTTT